MFRLKMEKCFDELKNALSVYKEAESTWSTAQAADAMANAIETVLKELDTNNIWWKRFIWEDILGCMSEEERALEKKIAETNPDIKDKIINYAREHIEHGMEAGMCSEWPEVVDSALCGLSIFHDCLSGCKIKTLGNEEYLTIESVNFTPYVCIAVKENHSLYEIGELDWTTLKE